MLSAAGSMRAGRRFSPVAFVGLVAVSGLAVVTVPAERARAQGAGDAPQEVPIGTFNLGHPHSGFSVVEPPAGVPERRRDSVDDGSGRWFFQGWERTPQSDTAETLYETAMKALDDGRTDEAQRLFERLISESPRSRRAGEARQHLGRIYRNVETGTTQASEPRPADAQAEGRGTLPWAQEGAPSVRPASVAPVDVSPALPPSLLQQARVSPTIDGQFLQDAGDRVFFSAGSAVLGTRARSVLQAQARFLLANPNLSAAVEGHADDGTLPNDATLRLSQERAAMVRDRLIAEGVEAHRLTAYGRGREERVSDCPAPECLAQNRRVVTILLSRRLGVDEALRRAQRGAAAPTAAPPSP